MEEFSKSYDCVRDQLWMTSVACGNCTKKQCRGSESDVSHSERSSKKTQYIICKKYRQGVRLPMMGQNPKHRLENSFISMIFYILRNYWENDEPTYWFPIPEPPKK